MPELRHERSFWKTALLALAVACVCAGCTKPVALNDPQVKPLLEAMNQVDRAALGFTSIEENAKMRLDRRSGSYDAMLHVYGGTSRTIAFRKTPSGYRWIAEQETHEGPKWEQTMDGNFRERITVQYQIEPVNGIPTNKVYIQYSGPQSELGWPRELTLAEVQPMLEKWRHAQVETEPPLLAGAGFPEPFAIFALLMFLAACVVALVVGAVGALVLLLTIGLLAGLIAAGMVSASVVIGVLRRSATTGFRALFFQFGGAIGLIMGSLGAWVFIVLAKFPTNSVKPWVIGPLLGVLFGLLAAWMFNFAWGRTVEWIARKLPGKKTVEVEAATASDQ
jgi:hypothetical protein